MARLAWFLSDVIKGPVVDQKGLHKLYDGKLSLEPDLFEGVKGLGLELKPQQGPVETYVIDHAERPTAYCPDPQLFARTSCASGIHVWN